MISLTIDVTSSTWPPPKRLRRNIPRGGGVPYSENAALAKFRRGPVSRRRPGAAGHIDRRGPSISPTAFHRELAVQKGNGRLEMGSNAMQHQINQRTARPRAVRTAAMLVAICVCSGTAAFAQVELAGSWAARNNEFLAGDGFPVDYTGMPLNDEGRTKGLSYSETQLAMVERQCQGWPAFYLVQGPFGLSISSETDPVKGTVISWTIGAWEDRAPLVIWMDGRPHPSKYAEHTRSGFTTGHWGRQYARFLHDAHESRVSTQDGPAEQRRGDAHAALPSSRRPARSFWRSSKIQSIWRSRGFCPKASNSAQRRSLPSDRRA